METVAPVLRSALTWLFTLQPAGGMHAGAATGTPCTRLQCRRPEVVVVSCSRMCGVSKGVNGRNHGEEKQTHALSPTSPTAGHAHPYSRPKHRQPTQPGLMHTHAATCRHQTRHRRPSTITHALLTCLWLRRGVAGAWQARTACAVRCWRPCAGPMAGWRASCRRSHRARRRTGCRRPSRHPSPAAPAAAPWPTTAAHSLSS